MSTPSFTLLETSLVGLEDIQRAAFLVFWEGINNALIEIAAYWEPRDQALDAIRGTAIAPTPLEEIENENFHEGHKPSLVKGSPESYPNIAVFGMQADPSAEDSRYDQIDSWIAQILVEVMVKGTDEITTNRRIQRNVEAAVLCIRRNPNLGGAVYGLNTRPSIVISDLFAVRSPSQGGAYKNQADAEGNRTGARYLWQGAQIRFRVQKDSAPPASGPESFDGASQVDYSQYIDQG